MLTIIVPFAVPLVDLIYQVCLLLIALAGAYMVVLKVGVKFWHAATDGTEAKRILVEEVRPQLSRVQQDENEHYAEMREGQDELLHMIRNVATVIRDNDSDARDYRGA